MLSSPSSAMPLSSTTVGSWDIYKWCTADTDDVNYTVTSEDVE